MGTEAPVDAVPNDNRIFATYDMIARGPLGWGHAACVNSKIHKHTSGGHQLCHSSRGGWVRVTDDWSLVDCKKCLKMRSKDGEDWTKVDANLWVWDKDSRIQVRVYKADFYGADLWLGEEFTSICAHDRKKDVVSEVLYEIAEWKDADMIEVFKARYLNEYCRPFEEAV
jgi:hypothetical protein